ncbi:MAG: hypothetical protein HY290_02330 [Planctomycetia bacterium]|nr:hypothetical protein [Planctomycetia bacterium]
MQIVRRACARRGLAPLELVLCLFFLLLMMALIINFGTISSWHLRGLTAARYGAWRTVAMRTGGGYPNPPNWQVRGASMGTAPGMPVNPNVINQVWNQNDLLQPAMRGPAIIDPATGNQILMGSQQYMELTNNALIGSANLTKTLPLLPNLRKSYIQPLHPIINHFWRFEDMSGATNNGGFNWAMRSNGDWRLFKWYLFEASQLPDGNLLEKFVQNQMADQMIQMNPGSAALSPLDRDDEASAKNSAVAAVPGNVVLIYVV